MNTNEANVRMDDEGGRQVLAIASVPMQNADFGKLFALDDALCRGTVFPALDLPFCGKGGKK